MTLRVFSSRDYVAEGEPHVLALYPFWGPASPSPWPHPEYADKLIASDVFVSSELPLADVAIFPLDWKHVVSSPDGLQRATAFVDAAHAAGKPSVFFWASDSTDRFPLEDAVVFRPSLFRSRRRRGEFALPGFHEDMLDHVGGGLPLRTWQSRPIISFCGHAVEEPTASGLAGRIRRVLGDARRGAAVWAGKPLRADIFVRRDALDRLSAQSAVDTNFVMRDEYGGVAAFYPHFDRDLWNRLRSEYVANMVDSDYVLCTRGHGNYSYRPSEAPSLGALSFSLAPNWGWPSAPLFNRRGTRGCWRGGTSRRRARGFNFVPPAISPRVVGGQNRGRVFSGELPPPLGYFANFHRHFGGWLNQGEGT